ncbi:hypothetical protein LCM02_11655 [Lutimonas saemankumensis]|uniref:hypothetical protein n=1 Tax=Lutimonas saemankumensis TaxID=483016 RepID=UPI001CD248ED|nr:hypothetical protein [Lutimonas saemankumensis]MCA0933110.1 hypothetical protein [Lutimonas saemankumensis]
MTGIYGLAATFVARQLFSNYYFGEFGLNVLPIDLFELLIFGWAFFAFLITLITISILVKRSTDPVGFKKRFNFLIPAFMSWIILFLLLKLNLSHIIVPIALGLFGLILINLNRFVSSKLMYMALLLILLGVVSFFLPKLNWLFIYTGFGILPIAFGLILLRKSKRQPELS